MESKNKKVLIGAAIIVLAVLGLSFSSADPSFSPHELVAKFKKAHTIESDGIMLTDKVSDFIKYKSGYVIGERFRSTLLVLGNDLKPIRRIGSKGDGPNELRNLGPLDVQDDNLVVTDRGHGRILVMTDEGVIKDEVKSEYFLRSLYNINVDDTKLMVSVADEETPVRSFGIGSGATSNDNQEYFRQVSLDRNRVYARNGNKGFVLSQGDTYFYLPPTETTIDIRNKSFELINSFDFGELDFLSHSKRRANQIYQTVNNQTIQYFEDVTQDGNNLYLLAYADELLPSGKYTRSLNHVIEVIFDENSQSLSQGRIIKLKDDASYSQIVVDNEKLLAFNYYDFTIDEYELEK